MFFYNVHAIIKTVFSEKGCKSQFKARTNQFCQTILHNSLTRLTQRCYLIWCYVNFFNLVTLV